jgi:hypothetical protein
MMGMSPLLLPGALTVGGGGGVGMRQAGDGGRLAVWIPGGAEYTKAPPGISSCS